MKYKLQLLTLVSVILIASCSKKIIPFDYSSYDYEASVVEIGTQGTAVIKATGVGKSIQEAKENAKRNAIHALLFKGIPSSNGINSTDLRPMVSDPGAQETYKDYFSSFFADNGKYMKFATFTNAQGEPGMGDVVRVGKSYKVGMVVTVNRNLLRQELENDGIIKRFGIN